MSTETTTEIASDKLKSNFIEILKSDGISDEVSQIIITEPPDLKGEHMTTAAVYVTVKFKDPGLKPKNLFMKKFNSNAKHAEMTKGWRVMEKESAFFSIFLPNFRAFSQNVPGGKNLSDFFPKCLYGDDEIVVLENVVLDKGFVMKSKEDKQDLETAKYVLGHLAQFHAANYAFVEDMGRETFLDKYEVIALEVYEAGNNPFVEQMFETTLAFCVNILKGYPQNGSEEAIEMFSSYIGNIYPFVMKTLNFQPKGKLAVVNHGDCWNNNMLFKLDKVTGNILDHVFVDLQITRYGSPNLDIGYFLYTSVKPEVRRACLEELLQHYFSVFQTTLAGFQLEMPVASFKEFLSDYKEHVHFGFFVHLYQLTAFGAMKDIDMNELPNEVGEQNAKIISKWIEKNPVLVAKISKEIIASQKEYLDLLSSS